MSKKILVFFAMVSSLISISAFTLFISGVGKPGSAAKLSPQTGDYLNIAIVFSVLALVAIMILLFVRKRKR